MDPSMIFFPLPSLAFTSFYLFIRIKEEWRKNKQARWKPWLDYQQTFFRHLLINSNFQWQWICRSGKISYLTSTTWKSSLNVLYWLSHNNPPSVIILYRLRPMIIYSMIKREKSWINNIKSKYWNSSVNFCSFKTNHFTWISSLCAFHF